MNRTCNAICFSALSPVTASRSKRRQARIGARAIAAASAAALTFAIAPAALAATYQVGPGKAHSNLDQVASTLQPGDIVEVMGDATYNGGVTFQKHGAPGQKITIRGITVNGKRPVISGGANTIEAAGNHYVFENLDITGGAVRCFFHKANDITVRDSVIHDCMKHGVLGADYGSGSMLLEYTELYRSGGGTQHHQVYMATDEVAYPGAVFRMQHCYVHDSNGGNNIKSRAENNEIYYNWIEGAMYHEVELIGPADVPTNLVVERGDVVGNVIVKRNGNFVARFGGDGTGETFGAFRFANNTVIVNPGGKAVFRLFDGIGSVEASNNVMVSTDGSPVSLVQEVDANWLAGSNIKGANNWVSGGSAAPAGWTGTMSGSNPGFVAMQGNDLRLAASSPLVDAATELPQRPQWEPPLRAHQTSSSATPRPVSGTIDVGAFEFAAASPPSAEPGTPSEPEPATPAAEPGAPSEPEPTAPAADPGTSEPAPPATEPEEAIPGSQPQPEESDAAPCVEADEPVLGFWMTNLSRCQTERGPDPRASIAPPLVAPEGYPYSADDPDETLGVGHRVFDLSADPLPEPMGDFEAAGAGCSTSRAPIDGTLLMAAGAAAMAFAARRRQRKL